MSNPQDMPPIADLDFDRAARAGIPEAVFAAGKTFSQVAQLSSALAKRNGRVLVTRLPQGWGQRLSAALASDLAVSLFGEERLAVVHRPGCEVERRRGRVGLLAAGTSDAPVAEEARVTALELGCEVFPHYDVGVAGLHRIFAPIEALKRQQVSVVIVVAGMEGALATVVKGLLACPVIGVPTSVGYGYGAAGQAALMSMLQSCSPGLTVVNIDNGFGAGASAALIANQTMA